MILCNSLRKAQVCRFLSWPAILAALLVALPAAGQNVDRDAKEKEVRAAASRNALGALQAGSEGTWTISRHRDTDLPRMLMNAKSKAYGRTAAEAAEAFVADNEEVFLPGNAAKAADEKAGMKASAPKELPGSAVVELRQEYRGTPVYGASMLVMVDAKGRVVHVTSTADPAVTVPGAPAKTFEDIDRIFRAAEAAKGVAVAAAGEGTLVVFPGKAPRWAYRAEYSVGKPGEPWEYVLDAETGAVLKAKRLVIEEGRKAGAR